MDDVIVGMEEEKGHNEVVEEVVRRLAENDLYVKLEKCKWKIQEVRFLDVLIRPEGMKMEEEKISRVLEWLTLKEVKDIQKFLGSANYYWQFIKDFTAIARLLYNLVKKDQKWDWTENKEEIFRELKERFTKKLVLVALDLDKKMRMEVDVPGDATGDILSMKCNDGKWRPVAFLSK